MRDQDKTIFALATPPGRAALQIIRLSGPQASLAVKTLCSHLPEPRQMAYTAMCDAKGDIIDRGMVAWFPSPSTPTGEDYAEFHLHGAPQIGHFLMLALEALPECRLADPGEFTRRAFLNGKMTLDQTEALADIIDADTVAQHRQAMARLDKPLSQTTNHWRQELIGMMVNLETALDFADEEIPDDLVDGVAIRLSQLRDDIGQLLNDANRGAIIRDGIKIALIGRPNAGKSTLLNALVGRPEAIVSPEAGTTRDIIQVTLNVAGYAVHLKDTAGLRISDSDVEKEGIRRAAETAREADIVVILIDAREPNKEVVKLALMDEAGLEATASRPLVMPVITKRDLLMDPEANLDSPTDFTPDQPEDWISIAAKTGEGLDEWYDAIKPMMAELVGDTNEAAMISRYRHRQALTACHDSLSQAQKVDLRLHPELLAEDLRHAATALGRISGHIDVEDILDDLFSSFCIGK